MKKARRKTPKSVPNQLETQALGEDDELLKLKEDQRKKLSTKRKMFQSKVPPQNLPDWETEIGMEGSDQFPTLNLRPVEVQGEKEGICLNTSIAIEVQELTPGKYLTHNLIGPLPQNEVEY